VTGSGQPLRDAGTADAMDDDNAMGIKGGVEVLDETLLLAVSEDDRHRMLRDDEPTDRRAVAH